MHAKQFVEIHHTGEDQNIPTVPVGMEALALHWVHWLRQNNSSLSWSEIQLELILRYNVRYFGMNVSMVFANQPP